MKANFQNQDDFFVPYQEVDIVEERTKLLNDIKTSYQNGKYVHIVTNNTMDTDPKEFDICMTPDVTVRECGNISSDKFYVLVFTSKTWKKSITVNVNMIQSFELIDLL